MKIFALLFGLRIWLACAGLSFSSARAAAKAAATPLFKAGAARAFVPPMKNAILRLSNCSSNGSYSTPLFCARTALEASWAAKPPSGRTSVSTTFLAGEGGSSTASASSGWRSRHFCSISVTALDLLSFSGCMLVTLLRFAKGLALLVFCISAVAAALGLFLGEIRGGVAPVVLAASSSEGGCSCLLSCSFLASTSSGDAGTSKISTSACKSLRRGLAKLGLTLSSAASWPFES
mmetsp:Transcript_6117/g.10578  ORF Transcript_6117/g.10578 Transcript_6117/m.10578 type:complete len:234 (-) Transcript_6117:1575-2276(-)